MIARHGNQLAIGFVLFGAFAGGCTKNTPLTGRTHPALPTDFALRFHVAGSANSDNLLEKTSQYVLEPNRHLHVALGAGATARFYPRLTRVITRDEYYDLSRHVFSHHLMAEPTSPGVRVSHTPVRYELEITAHGRTHRYATTAAESPPTLQLLKSLANLHGHSLAPGESTRPTTSGP